MTAGARGNSIFYNSPRKICLKTAMLQQTTKTLFAFAENPQGFLKAIPKT